MLVSLMNEVEQSNMICDSNYDYIILLSIYIYPTKIKILNFNLILENNFSIQY